MYAIVEIAGQQFKVSKDQRLFVHRLASDVDAKVSFEKVLLIDNGGALTLGAPAIEGASIEAKVTPLAIALFIKNTNDPLVNSLITDIIKSLINNPYTISKVEQRLLPTLISILNSTLNSTSEYNNSDQKDFTSLLTVS